jgi:hypothetical protein
MTSPGATVSRELLIVLPPGDGLSGSERARVRMLVERAFETALPAGAAGAPSLQILEPADRDSLVDTVERAVRRAGAGGTVCVLGGGSWSSVAPVFALYPATRACLLPSGGSDPDGGQAGMLLADVDLERLGRELGSAARAAAGARAVIVLDGGDAMLDRRWRAAVESGAVAAGGTTGPSGIVYAVRSAAELLTLLDEQTALLAEGIVPGSVDALAGDDGQRSADLLFRDDSRTGRTLPPVGVVVLDGSVEAALLVAPLAEQGVLVIGPRSLLIGEDVNERTVVLRWRIRWDLPLVALIRHLATGDPLPANGEELLVLEPGAAHARS